MADRLPAGIHFRSGESPPDHFRFVTCNFAPSATSESARDAVKAICSVLDELREGGVRDLVATRPDDPAIRVDPGSLAYVFAYGPRLFDAAGRQQPLVDAAFRPDRLPMLRSNPSGPFPALRWSPTGQPLAAQTDFAIQLTGTSQLAVTRPIVEIQKAIDDLSLPVRIVCFFSGIHRDDRRSWIDFHDGINNMRSGERLEAIEIADAAHAWMEGGTTLAFLKIGIDLQGWRRLDREQQEALVGRDKLSGCPIERIGADASGTLSLDRAPCPANAEIDRSWPDEAQDPPSPGDTLAAASHIHRANLLRLSPATAAANRIYRQGYEFVDSPPDGGVRVGLNFVSYQCDTSRVLNILRSANWMGDANFGGIEGDPAVPAFKLMDLIAGGLFAVPPVERPFPGYSIFPS